MKALRPDAPETDEDDPLRWLQRWYESQCDGNWEHEYGVEIGTLDNPGWRLAIDVTQTALDKRFATVEWHRSEHEWLVCRLEGAKFLAYCGPHQLVDAISAFRSWVGESSRNP